MIKLSKEQVILLHERLIEATGGSNGIRDNGMLDSALANPFQSFGDKELYPSVQAKAAQLCFGIVKNHPMVDGNKRLGTHVMFVFLALNGYELSYTQKELSDTILDLASGKIGGPQRCGAPLGCSGRVLLRRSLEIGRASCRERVLRLV